MKKYCVLLLLSILLLSCSSKNDKDYYTSAQINEQKGQSKEAIADYEKVVTEFPKSNVADSCLYRMAQLEIETKSYANALRDFKKLTENYPNSKLITSSLFELGKLYHGKVLKKLPEFKSYKIAVDYYKKVFERDKNFPDAAQALFMAGFLEANELHNYDAAKSTYNRFIKSFPQNKLVASAKEEIKTLGISPEDILKKSVRK